MTTTGPVSQGSSADALRCRGVDAPDMDAQPPLVLTADETEALRATGVLTSPSVAVGTIRMERFC